MPLSEVRNLGVVLDASFSMEAEDTIPSNAFYYLRLVKQLVLYLDFHDLAAVILAIVTSRTTATPAAWSCP